MPLELRGLNALAEAILDPSSAALHGAETAASALAIARLAQAARRPVLLLAQDSDTAIRVWRDLEFFLPFFSAADDQPELLHLPGWEISPYKKIAPSTSARFDRLRTLHRIQQKQRGLIVVSSWAAAAQCAIPPELLRSASLELRAGEEHDPDRLSRALLYAGYSAADPVEDPATFARRGGIMDIFSPAGDWPLRLDFLGDEIESVRPYNPTTQRSLSDAPGTERWILPAREFSCAPESLESARARIKEWADDHDIPRPQRDRVNDPLAKGIVTQEMDYLISYFHARPARAWEHFAAPPLVVWLEKETAAASYRGFWEKQQELYESAISQHEIAAPPDQLFAAPEELQNQMSAWPQLQISSVDWLTPAGTAKTSFTSERNLAFLEKAREDKKGKRSANLDLISQGMQSLFLEGYRVVFVANSQAQLDRFAFLISQRSLRSQAVTPGSLHAHDWTPGSIHLVSGNISSGFRLPAEKIAFISEDEVFGQKKHIRSEKRRTESRALSATTLDHLQNGDLVVHVDHGIGRYRGLIKLAPGGVAGDYVFIEYAGADKLYLPVYRLECIQKYTVAGSGAGAALDKLGSQQFAKAKERVKAAVKDIAAKLLRIYAERATRESYAFSEPNEVFREFEATFPFDETPDQLKAIQDTIGDMCAARPMDRLVCGDVGFGKTEVAIRAAFKACQDGKQVAVLAPTTILAEQHFQTFSKRFADHGIRVACLSRFRSRKEQSQIIADLAGGKVDVVIGTHRLLSKDVKLGDLGLLVIDEEQRFGVEHKEKLKQFKATTDVLTLTATPIPRTLHLALMGMRDISIIATAPVDRLSIRTYLAPYNPDTIRSAIENELARGGQIYFIHNRVQSIPTIFRELQELVPKARIAVGHGQMPEGELEKVMHSFYKGESDVLLSTTIIENGLDIANANTIIVNRADTFGLSQLYQIRGRVGRSQARAFAYFLVPEDRDITDDAKERLRVLQRFVELGSGFAVASHDLEIRGGGDILGDAQSGHIADVGYDLYLELLEEEILRLKGEAKEKREDVEIHSPFPAFLPESYVPDMRSRLSLYKSLSDLSSEESIEKAEGELRDRYGPPPPEALELLQLLRTKILLRRLGFRAIHVGRQALTVVAGSEPKVDPQKIMALIRRDPRRYTLTPDNRLTLRAEFSSLKAVHDELRQTIAAISSL